jgi:hypothetical protein
MALRRTEEERAVLATFLSAKGRTIGIKAGLTAFSPIREEFDGIGLGRVGSNGDRIG